MAQPPRPTRSERPRARGRSGVFDAPEVRAALLAARWAQRIGLPPGNLWEPAIARQVLAEYRQTGSWAFVEAMYCLRLGLTVEP